MAAQRVGAMTEVWMVEDKAEAGTAESEGAGRAEAAPSGEPAVVMQAAREAVAAASEVATAEAV